MEKDNYQRLSYRERVIIETLWAEKRSKTFIANQLNRDKSTVSRELNKWIQNDFDTYDARLAHWCAQEDYLTKRKLDRITQYSVLRFYVFRGLLRKWSPEQISGRIKRDYPEDPLMRISYESIYAYIYRHPNGKLNKKLISLLPRHRARRRKRIGPVPYRVRIEDATSIDQRPQEISERMEIGHWEGDLMIGRDRGSALGTLVERKTRFTYIMRLKDRKSETVTGEFIKVFNKLSSRLKKTMTYDNGFEMSGHKMITEKTGVKVYFAHPYSSWERGTNENTNGLIRRFLPKRTDFNLVTDEELAQIQERLNHRPRKVLAYRTPVEEVEKELQKRWSSRNDQSVNVRK